MGINKWLAVTVGAPLLAISTGLGNVAEATRGRVLCVVKEITTHSSMSTYSSGALSDSSQSSTGTIVGTRILDLDPTSVTSFEERCRQYFESLKLTPKASSSQSRDNLGNVTTNSEVTNYREFLFPSDPNNVVYPSSSKNPINLNNINTNGLKL